MQSFKPGQAHGQAIDFFQGSPIDPGSSTIASNSSTLLTKTRALVCFMLYEAADTPHKAVKNLPQRSLYNTCMMAEPHFNKSIADAALLVHITGAYNDPLQFPDLTVVCSERQWHCHKLILCAHSEWFKKACSGDFAEANQKTIELKDDDDVVLRASSTAMHMLTRFQSQT